MTKRRIDYYMKWAREENFIALHIGGVETREKAKSRCLGIITLLEGVEALPETFREELEDMYVQLMYV